MKSSACLYDLITFTYEKGDALFGREEMGKTYRRIGCVDERVRDVQQPMMKMMTKQRDSRWRRRYVAADEARPAGDHSAVSRRDLRSDRKGERRNMKFHYSYHLSIQALHETQKEY